MEDNVYCVTVSPNPSILPLTTNIPKPPLILKSQIGCLQLLYVTLIISTVSRNHRFFASPRSGGIWGFHVAHIADI